MEMDVEDMIETWRGPLTGLLAGWGAGWSEAAELAQDTLVEAYLGRQRLRGDPGDPARIGPWLAGIARNLWRSSRRARGRRREEALPGDSIPDQGALFPEEDVRSETLRRAMARLPEKFRVVLYLHYLEQTSVREVAALLELPPKTVESRLHQARELLRGRLIEKAEDRA
jgi:RNA polymerase sigma-70 factor, ECF subfamily